MYNKIQHPSIPNVTLQTKERTGGLGVGPGFDGGWVGGDVLVATVGDGDVLEDNGFEIGTDAAGELVIFFAAPLELFVVG